MIIIVAHSRLTQRFFLSNINHCIRLCVACNNTVDRSALSPLIIVRLPRRETRDKILGNTGFHSLFRDVNDGTTARFRQRFASETISRPGANIFETCLRG